jgi:hypothetical protein
MTERKREKKKEKVMTQREGEEGTVMAHRE